MAGTGRDMAEKRGSYNGRGLPVVRLALYYGLLVAVGAVVVRYVPGGRDALVAPIAVPGAGDFEALLTGGHPTATAAPTAPWAGAGGRGLLTLIAVIGALALAAPVAWVHMYTRRLRYDPSLIHAIIVLPIVVAGVVLVVKNSLALAFALAGIVAGVRFRQKLNEPQEAVYVLLSLGIGLAAGVQALDVALVMSLAFNGVVLVVWRYDVGSIYSGGRGAVLIAGDGSVLGPSSGETRRTLLARATDAADGMDADGIIVVHAVDADGARRIVEATADRVAKDWRVTEPVADGRGLTRFEIVLQLRKSADPVEIMAELEERCGRQLVAAEYVPFRPDEDEEDEA